MLFDLQQHCNVHLGKSGFVVWLRVTVRRAGERKIISFPLTSIWAQATATIFGFTQRLETRVEAKSSFPMSLIECEAIQTAQWQPCVNILPPPPSVLSSVSSFFFYPGLRTPWYLSSTLGWLQLFLRTPNYHRCTAGMAVGPGALMAMCVKTSWPVLIRYLLDLLEGLGDLKAKMKKGREGEERKGPLRKTKEGLFGKVESSVAPLGKAWMRRYEAGRQFGRSFIQQGDQNYVDRTGDQLETTLQI